MSNVFITGVSSGIGHALAKKYLADGNTVIGVSRRTPKDLLQNNSFVFAAVDIAKTNLATVVIEKLLQGVQRIDLAILNAGTLGEISDMKDVSLEELRRLMDVNVWANKTVLDVLFSEISSIKQVVAISSGAAVNGNRGWAGYSISKAALNMLVQLYSREQAGTHFCSLAPGLVDTAMQDYLCGRPQDWRFDSLDTLKARRNTDEMPTAEKAAERLVAVMARLPSTKSSGEFVDLRDLQ